jgi:hypothetical protein
MSARQGKRKRRRLSLSLLFVSLSLKIKIRKNRRKNVRVQLLFKLKVKSTQNEKMSGKNLSQLILALSEGKFCRIVFTGGDRRLHFLPLSVRKRTKIRRMHKLIIKVRLLCPASDSVEGNEEVWAPRFVPDLAWPHFSRIFDLLEKVKEKEGFRDRADLEEEEGWAEEGKAERFLAWLTENGAAVPGLSLRLNEGRNAFEAWTKGALEGGALVFSLPPHLSLSMEVADERLSKKLLSL